MLFDTGVAGLSRSGFMKRLAALALTLALSGETLAGCGGDQVPTPTAAQPATTVAATAQPSTTAAPPTPQPSTTATPGSARPWGQLDESFGDGGRVVTDMGSVTDEIHAMVIQPDGKIVAAGVGRPTSDRREHFALARYKSDGSLDSGFGDGGKVGTPLNEPSLDTSSAEGLALQPDGKLVAVGSANNLDVHRNTFAVARYNPDGSMDAGFGKGGKVLTPVNPETGAGPDDVAHAVAIAGDGKIVAVGEARGFPRDFAVVRYNADGSLDKTFGKDGLIMTDLGGDDTARAVAIQPDGKIVVAGDGANNMNDWAMARYNADGSLDTTFGKGGLVTTDFIGGQDWANGIVLRPDGKIVLGGYWQVPCPYTRCERWGFALARYNSDGSLDSTFGDAGKSESNWTSSASAYGLASMPDGRLVLAGHFDNEQFAVAVYMPDGRPDETFGDGGLVKTDFVDNYPDRAFAVVVQPDGRIIAAGGASVDEGSGDTPSHFGLVRYK